MVARRQAHDDYRVSVRANHIIPSAQSHIGWSLFYAVEERKSSTLSGCRQIPQSAGFLGLGGSETTSLEIPDQLHVYETDFWLLNHRIDSALPGYLMLGSKLPVGDLSELPDSALAALGPLLAKVQHTLRTKLKPTRVYIGRYGHSPGYPIHFHLIPVYEWVEALFWRDDRYRVFERFSETHSEPATDGAELTLFVWREFCERSNPPPTEGPSVAEAIALIREGMAR